MEVRLPAAAVRRFGWAVSGGEKQGAAQLGGAAAGPGQERPVDGNSLRSHDHVSQRLENQKALAQPASVFLNVLR